jgi:hypothetical protein
MRNLIVWVAQTIPPNIQEHVDEARDLVNANPQLKWTLIGIGAFCALIFVFGIIKHAFKAAFLFAILSVAAWIWYFNIR